MDVESLVEEVEQARWLEQEAKSNRIMLENDLLDCIKDQKLEGTVSKIFGKYKITVTNSLTRKIHLDKLQEALDAFGSESLPIRTKYEADLKMLRKTEEENPELFSACQELIEVKPAKPTIKITEVKEND